MSGAARRVKKLEMANGDTRGADYWFLQHLKALNKGAEAQQAKAEIEAVIAAGGSPGYRGFQAIIADVFARRRDNSRHPHFLTESDYSEMGAA